MANSTRPAEFLYDNMMIHATVVHAGPPVAGAASCSTSAARASTRGSRPSRSRRRRCSPARSSRPTRRTPWPRSPASSSAAPTARSTAATSSRPCRPTSTARATTSTSRAATSCRRSCASSTTPSCAGDRRGRDLGHRHADARVPPRRRPRRRLPLPDGATTTTPGTSTSAPALDVTIRELAETVRDIVHPGAELVFDASKPDGMPRKVLDVAKINALGWTAADRARRRHPLHLRVVPRPGPSGPARRLPVRLIEGRPVGPTVGVPRSHRPIRR